MIARSWRQTSGVSGNGSDGTRTMSSFPRRLRFGFAIRRSFVNHVRGSKGVWKLTGMTNLLQRSYLREAFGSLAVRTRVSTPITPTVPPPCLRLTGDYAFSGGLFRRCSFEISSKSARSAREASGVSSGTADGTRRTRSPLLRRFRSDRAMVRSPSQGKRVTREHGIGL